MELQDSYRIEVTHADLMKAREDTGPATSTPRQNFMEVCLLATAAKRVVPGFRMMKMFTMETVDGTSYDLEGRDALTAQDAMTYFDKGLDAAAAALLPLTFEVRRRP